MERREIGQTVKVTCAVALALALLAWPLFGGDWALCFALSAAWGAGNLWLLARVFTSLMGPDQNFGIALYWALMKPPFLIGGGAALILSPFFAPSAFIIGFHVVLPVLVIRHFARLHAERAAFASGGAAAC